MRYAAASIPLPDPQVARELGIVAPNLLDEALGVAADEDVDRVASGLVGERLSSTTAYTRTRGTL
jgi:hypothetical protein